MSTASRILLSSLFALTLGAPAQAGRPLTVDDANVAEAGTGHVEAWYARRPDRADTWTVAPAYVPVDGLELGARILSDRTADETTGSVQAKWRITPSLESGCNAGAVLGVARRSGAGGNTPFVNGLFTCNGAWGATHFNLGAAREPGEPTLGIWGVAMNASSARSPPMSRPSASASPNPSSTSARELRWPKDCRSTAPWDAATTTLFSLGLKQLF